MLNGLQPCIDRALAALLARRNPAGFWEGLLASSPLATAVSLCALDRDELPAERREKSHAYLAKTQNADGGWGDTEISKSNLAASLLALCADAMQPFLIDAARTRANAYVENLGGVSEGLRKVYGKDLTFQVPIKMTAAYAGLTTGCAGFTQQCDRGGDAGTAQPTPNSPHGRRVSWTDVDPLPFELALAPRSLMGALRLPVVSYALPALVCVGLSRHAKAPSWAPVRWWREACADRALDLILKMQPASGGYLEATPITAFCRIGLKAAGRGAHPVAENAKKFLLATQRPDGSWPVEVHLSVWNTTRAIDALAAGGLLETALSEQERATTRDWLLAQQCRTRSVYSDTQPGGWGWNHLSGSVPDADDTAGAIIALRHLGVAATDAALVTGRRWLEQIQNSDGGWPTFCRGWNKLPFDRSAPDLSAHAMRAMWDRKPPRGQDFTFDSDLLEMSEYCSSLTPGTQYLERSQRRDGSFAPLWFGCENAKDSANATYGATHVLFNDPTAQISRRAMKWLLSIQDGDGGFGGCAGAPSTAEETGLALRAMVMFNVGLDSECDRAAQWLIDHQRADGSWDPSPIGFYFAVLWYYEELYPLVYALGGLSALARTRKNVEAVTAA